MKYTVKYKIIGCDAETVEAAGAEQALELAFDLREMKLYGKIRLEYLVIQRHDGGGRYAGTLDIEF